MDKALWTEPTRSEKAWYSESWKPFSVFVVIAVVAYYLVDRLTYLWIFVIGFVICCVVTVLLMRHNETLETYSDHHGG